MNALAVAASLATPLLIYRWFDTGAEGFEQSGRLGLVVSFVLLAATLGGCFASEPELSVQSPELGIRLKAPPNWKWTMTENGLRGTSPPGNVEARIDFRLDRMRKPDDFSNSEVVLQGLFPHSNVETTSAKHRIDRCQAFTVKDLQPGRVVSHDQQGKVQPRQALAASSTAILAKDQVIFVDIAVYATKEGAKEYRGLLGDAERMTRSIELRRDSTPVCTDWTTPFDRLLGAIATFGRKLHLARSN
jgi:hypothetical protein